MNIFLFCFFLLFVLLWFIKFPLYRYGSSFLIVFFVYITILFTKNFEYSKQEKNIRFLFNFFLIIAVSAFFTKNSLRIYKKYNSGNYFPKIHNFNIISQSKETKLKKIILNNKGYYFLVMEYFACMVTHRVHILS